jgi:TatD DNase family protein
VIDFHCHLDLYPDARNVASRCVDLGVDVLSVTTTPMAWSGTLALGQGAGCIRTALGLHPQLAGERASEIDLFERLLPSARFVGEVGLDGSPDLRTSWQAQEAVFARILDVCTREGGRVMSIHSRRASSAVLDAIAKRPHLGIPVLHWFSGSPAELKRAISLGCWFSVGLPMLESRKGRALVMGMPRDRILTETDGPFVARMGKGMLPWDVRLAADALAALWECESDDVDQQLSANHSRLLDPPS